MKSVLKSSELIEALNARFATKVFDSSKKLSSEQLDTLIESLRLTPSAFGLQPWKFVLVEDPALRAQLRENSWGQPQVTDASHLFVLMARTEITAGDISKFIETTAKARGITIESLDAYKQMMEGSLLGLSSDAQAAWASKQAYIALGNLLTAAAVLGVDTCPMEGLDAAAYDKLLEVDGYTTCLACPVGFASADDKYASLAKVRYSRNEVLLTK